MNTAKISRYHSLDRLRAIAMLLGLVVHSTIHYFVLPVQSLQVYLDRNTSLLLELLCSFLHAHRVPVFFVVAGFFAALLYDSRGAGAFFVHRMNRVGVPLVIGLFMLFPLVALATSYAQLSTVGPKMTEAQFDAVFEGLFMHLWFLYYLLLYSVAAIGASFLVSRISGNFRHATRGVFGQLFDGPVMPIVLSVPTALVLFHMENWTFDYSSSPLPPLRLLSGYALFFTFGWFVFKRQDILKGFATRAWINLLAGTLLFALYRYFYVRKLGPDESALDHLLCVVFLAVSIWLIVYASLGLCLRYFDGPSRCWRYLSDASYWMYLIHLPIAIALAPVLSDVDVIAEIKFAFVFVATTVISLVTYHFLVRSTFVGARLNGRKYPRVVPWRQTAAG